MFVLSCPAHAFKLWSKQITEGVMYIHTVITPSAGKPVDLYAVEVDIKAGSFEVFPDLARDTVGRLESVGSIAKRDDAIAAINGSFFKRNRPYLPIGLLMINGNIITKSLLNRSAVGIIDNRQVQFGIPKFVGKIINTGTGDEIAVWGVNRPRKENEIIVYTPDYGYRTRTNDTGVELIIEDNIVFGISSGNSPIPRNGYVISFHGWTKDYSNSLPPGAYVEAKYSLSQGWEKADHVITAGPRLIENGKNVALACTDSENCGSDLTGRNARTAIGVTWDDKLFLVVSEGNSARRRMRRKGLTFSELADAMVRLGVKDAIALDGGSSSTMFINDVVVNIPADGFQQGVSNALLVKFAKP